MLLITVVAWSGDTIISRHCNSRDSIYSRLLAPWGLGVSRASFPFSPRRPLPPGASALFPEALLLPQEAAIGGTGSAVSSHFSPPNVFWC